MRDWSELNNTNQLAAIVRAL